MQLFIEAVYRELLAIYSRGKCPTEARQIGLTPGDLASYAIRQVIEHPECFTDKTVLHVANARSQNAFHDLRRRVKSDRGEGARGTREVINDGPVNKDKPKMGSVIQLIPDCHVPQDEWIEQEHHRGVLDRVMRLVPDPAAWRAFDLIVNDGLTQAQVARLLGVSTRTLIRKMNVIRRVTQENAIQVDWQAS